MAYVDHDNLWNMSNMVDEYNIQAPTLLWSESCLTEKSKSFLKENVHNILCVGCGGGREVLPLHQTFENATIYANDIAEK
jgi:2-polyprenyl-3-methyl-5-hydroxy-6-metoxy-1,4-benzoquinol methylase